MIRPEQIARSGRAKPAHPRTILLTPLFLALVNAALGTAVAASPPPSLPTVDTSGVLELEQSPEESMVGGDLPPTPESGTENAQDLLRSAPIVHPPKATKSASAKQHKTADGMPDALPLVPGSKPDPLPQYEEPPPAAEASAPTEELPPEQTAEAPPAPLEDVTVPAEPEAVASETESGTSTKRWDRSVPLYERETPNWGWDIHGSMQALGKSIKSPELDTNGNATGNINETDVVNFGLGFEWEPSFLQSIGVVSLGPSFNLYTMQPGGDLTENAFSVYSLGFSAKYQLNFMRGQWLVPFVGFESQLIHYSFNDADVGTGWTTAVGPTFGALIALNWMEPSAAHNLFADTGIRRSYLVGEIKQMTAGEDLLSTDGIAIYFGLRLEH